MSNNVNDNNYAEIVIFMQKNKFDSNNKLIDEIIKEADESKKQKLIEKIANNNDIDFITSGYTVQLFRIFNNIDLFCIKESKVIKFIICGKEEEIIPNESKPFIYIKIDDLIKRIYLMYLFMSKYKEKLSYDCEWRKGKSEDLLCTKIKYNILSYPTFIFVLFDMN